MLNTRSLRFRVAAWYFASVTAIFALAAAGYWLAVRSALDDALDQGLRYRLAGLRQYLDARDPSEGEDLGASLDRLFRLGELYQVFDGDGRLLAQSYGLAAPSRAPRSRRATSAPRSASSRAAPTAFRSVSPRSASPSPAGR